MIWNSNEGLGFVSYRFGIWFATQFVGAATVSAQFVFARADVLQFAGAKPEVTISQ
ncbi:uncharacterized protein DS421_18g612950 [Arachis hypogaea]|nr:uncharacterized protein DS421_18g612950 [Arachis hypogaea]